MRAFNPSEAQIAKDFSAISPELMGAAKLEAGIGEKDASVLTVDEMVRHLSVLSFGHESTDFSCWLDVDCLS